MKYTPYYNLSDLIDFPTLESYSKAARDKKLEGMIKSLADLGLTPPTLAKEEFLAPVSIFDTGRQADTVNGKMHYVSLGIFDLDPKSATATITKNGKLEITWTERAGKGKFASIIPSYLVPTSAPILSYEGGVLDISVPVKLKSENDVVFVGKLELKSFSKFASEKEQTNEGKGGSYNYQKPERVD